MLTQLSITNFAIVDQLDLDIQSGMSVITGETGAGKSIMLDALGLATGSRTDSHCIRPGADRAEIHACFDLSHNPTASRWLKDKELDCDGECILRRVITKEGRSRAYINGTPSPLFHLCAIGEQLVDIHGQHEHQSLLKKHNHGLLLDNYAGSSSLVSTANQCTQKYNRLKAELNTLISDHSKQNERIQLLTYQLEEFETIALQEGELEKLEKELRQLSNAEATLSACHQVAEICAHNEAANLLQQLHTCINRLDELQVDHPTISNSMDMLSSAHIQIEEVVGDIHSFIDQFEADPQRMEHIDQRLSTLYELARKHRIQPDELINKQESLRQELTSIQFSDERVEVLQTQLDRLRSRYHAACEQLTAKRTKAARTLSKQVSDRMALLGMPHGQFNVMLSPRHSKDFCPTGAEEVEFLVTTNPGQSPRTLAKVASGGELSRISLAIQVITAQTSLIPTVVFDEVDVGIGGGTAEIVGSMLRELGEKNQVLCVTHQPQVASQGHHHLHVRKQVRNAQSHTNISTLNGDEKVREIARMLGGLEITQPTLNHAREMLGNNA